MYAITGITGQVGGAVARALLTQSLPVRAIVRDATKAAPWRDRGCHVAVARFDDPHALQAAFTGATAVFILPPPVFDPTPDFSEAWALATTLQTVLQKVRPVRVVYLSTIGAQSPKPNLLTQHTIIEQALRSLPIPITFLRPAWFMENCSWEIAPAIETGVIPSFLQPLDKPVPMVATEDIGNLAAELLQKETSGHQTYELEGPHRVPPNQIAAIFARILEKPIKMQTVPRESWMDLFRAQGMKNPLPRTQMLDGFNEGWIEFEAGPTGSLKGSTSLETVLRKLIAREHALVS